MALPYFPYFRGKQYELIAIRECAALMAGVGFVPIIEPVKESLGGLERTLKEICESRGKAIVIINPRHGDHKSDGESIVRMLQSNFALPAIAVGVLLQNELRGDEAVALCEKYRDLNLALVHAGFTESRVLADGLTKARIGISQHVFIDPHAGLMYRRHFADHTCVLVRDGFNRRRNADYPEVEKFSELHLTYQLEGMSGFGDFLIVGDDFSEGGGPAYAVAVHLTFINSDDEDTMYIYHFVSDTNDTPTDPAGKFAQALEKLAVRYNSGQSHLIETEALKEFLALHKRGHFPGLGYVKKLSMKHHIETLANFPG